MIACAAELEMKHLARARLGELGELIMVWYAHGMRASLGRVSWQENASATEGMPNVSGGWDGYAARFMMRREDGLKQGPEGKAAWRADAVERSPEACLGQPHDRKSPMRSAKRNSLGLLVFVCSTCPAAGMPRNW